jgi:hypothetical protein
MFERGGRKFSAVVCQMSKKDPPAAAAAAAAAASARILLDIKEI